MEEHGIKESKELLNGCIVLVGLCIRQLKDGFQIEDLPVILSKLGYEPELQAAWKGVSAIPKEVADLNLNEVMELAGVLLKGVPRILDELKK